jgi:hypothetical protein
MNGKAIWLHAAGLARWAAIVAAPSVGGGFHNVGEILLALLVLGGLGFGVTRLRRNPPSPRSPRRTAPHEDQSIGREPPSSSPSSGPGGGTVVASARRSRTAASSEPPAGGPTVETHGLTKRFGANVAVDGVELRVPRGSRFGYLGPNGAGKTTLMRTLLGLTRASGGTMSLLGVPVPAGRKRALARVGAIVDEPRFHQHLTGRDNLRLLAKVERTCDAVAIVDRGRVIRQGPIDELIRGAGTVVVQVDCAAPHRRRDGPAAPGRAGFRHLGRRPRPGAARTGPRRVITSGPEPRTARKSSR